MKKMLLLWVIPLLLYAYDFEIKDTLALRASPGRLSPDGLRFICGLKAEDGAERLYEYTRASLDDDWGAPELLAGEINEASRPFNSSQPTLSADGRMIVFVCNSKGFWEDNDLWMATRKDTTKPFSNIRMIAVLATEGAEAYPFLSCDGRRLYYVTDQGLTMAKYHKGKGVFKELELVLFEDSPSIISAWLSADELSIVISDGYALSYAERKSLKEPLCKPTPIFISDNLGFVASPSFDPNGELYLYCSFEMQETEESRNRFDKGIIEGLLEEEGNITEDTPEESSLDMILILTPTHNVQGGK